MWHPGYAPIWFHLVTDFLSLFVAGYYYSKIYHKKNNSEDSINRMSILIGAALGALIGSRLIASLEHPDLFFNPPSLLYYYSVKTVVGGIAGGILGVEIAKKMLGIKKSVGNIMIGPLSLGIIIGRIGCFMVGVCDGTVGVASSLPWAFDQGDGIARHPTSLYEIIWVAIFWFTILRFKKNSKVYEEGSGLYFRLFCVGYFTFRFFVEFVKPVTPIFLGITAIQWTCVFVVFGYGYSILKIVKST